METVQNSTNESLPVADEKKKPLPVADEKKKLTPNENNHNLNSEHQQGDTYMSQTTPSVSPASLSEEEEDHLMIVETRDEEATVRSCSSSSSEEATVRSCSISSSTETVLNLPSNAADEYYEADVDSEDGLFNNDGSMKASTVNTQNQVYTCRRCRLSINSRRSYLHHLKNDHNLSIYECAICDFVANCQQRLDGHQRKVHYSRDSENSSTDSTEGASLARKTIVSDASCLNSLPQNSVFVKEEVKDLEDDNSDTPPTNGVTTSHVNTADNRHEALDETKKKKTRQEVDPGKYFEVVDGSGVKYGCAHCGNIYKWRKSLSKHWKEKHNTNPFLETAHSPGMFELLKTGKYTKVGARKVYDEIFLNRIKTRGSDDDISSPTSLNRSSGQYDVLNTSSSFAPALDLPSTYIPPFARVADLLLSNHQPVFSGVPIAFAGFPTHSDHFDSTQEGILDLSCGHNYRSGNSSFSQAITLPQDKTLLSDWKLPLTLSRNNTSLENVASEMLQKNVKSMTSSSCVSQSIPELPHCSKSDSLFTAETEFASYTNSHTHKRVVTCYECKLQMRSMNELNNHFMEQHIQMLSDFKETIKKIPHGLQQSYHLLDMELQDIVKLRNQDLGAPDGINLKCKKCDFVTKLPADLQIHVELHSEARPFICTICGATYKYKWDMVKHVNKSHANLPNPFIRKDTVNAESSEDDEEPLAKHSKLEMSDTEMNGNICNRSDAVSMAGIIEATQRQAWISRPQNGLDLVNELNHTVPSVFMNTSNVNGAHMEQIFHADQAVQRNDRFLNTHEARTPCMLCNGNHESSSCKEQRIMETASPEGSRPEKLPYKCTECDFHALSPSEVTQHMKIHSELKPFKCPGCDYRSKWKWDVVKHMKRCVKGGINDVIDTRKPKTPKTSVDSAPPNVIANKKGKGKRRSPQPPFPQTLQSPDEQASFVSHNETQDYSLQLDSKALSNNSIMNSDNTTAINTNVDNNHKAQRNGLQFPSFNQVNTTTSSVLSSIGDARPSSKSLSHSNSVSRSNRLSRRNIVSHSNSTKHSSSADVWCCFHCPFTTQNQAALKRHSDIHSDNKPFKCDQCSYSSRWLSDLRKHRKAYDHLPKKNGWKDNEETHAESQLAESRSAESRPAEPRLVESKPVESQRAKSRPTESKPAKSKPTESRCAKSQPRFECSQCVIYFDTLQNLVDHRLTDHIGKGSNQSSLVTLDHGIDMARLKHPRKRVRYIQCPQCIFICGSHKTMESHLNDHEKNFWSCTYCKSMFRDRESLLDHLTVHSAFNPIEWETYFMSEVELQQFDRKNSNHIKCQDENNEKSTVDPSLIRIQQILNETPMQGHAILHGSDNESQIPTTQSQVLTTQKGPQAMLYKCEWCREEFTSLTAIYNHARSCHPIELKDQVAGIAMDVDDEGPQMMDHINDMNTEETGHQLTDKHTQVVPKIQDAMNNKTDDKHKYDYDKYDAPSTSSAYHEQPPGNKLTVQCRFCDLSIQNTHLLQHVMTFHRHEAQALKPVPKSNKDSHRISSASSSTRTLQDDSLACSSKSALDINSKNEMSCSEMTDTITYVPRQQYIWNGTPVNVVIVNDGLTFVCPHCNFHDDAVAEACNHVAKNHKTLSKYNCKKCHFSHDNKHIISDHCEKEHHPADRIVEVLDFMLIDFKELQILQLNVSRKQLTCDTSKNASIRSRDKPVIMETLRCPFCPFKTLSTEAMKGHVKNHTNQAKHQCSMCDFSSDSTAVITEHGKVHEDSYTSDKSL